MSRVVDKMVLLMVFLFTLISLTKLNPRDYVLILIFLSATVFFAIAKRRLSGGRFEIREEATS